MGKNPDKKRSKNPRPKHMPTSEVPKEPAPVEPPPPAEVEPDRQRFVRRTVDLSREDHLDLTRWCNATAVEIGVARVTGADTFRALVDRLLTDEELAQLIREDLQRSTLST